MGAVGSMGYLVISIDCEGLWGLADQPHWFGRITDESLSWAYTHILRSLERHKLVSTFAFVGAFAKTADEIRDEWDSLTGSQARFLWLRHSATAHRMGELSGWHSPITASTAGDAGHEIASHSYTHLPLRTKVAQASDVVFEFERSIAWGDSIGERISTYVFPRNEVVGIEAMPAHGIQGYRTPLASETRFGRLAAELHPRRGCSPIRAGAPVAIPGEHFMNWRRGLRGLIPAAYTARAWARVLDDATHHGGVAHLWFHPHNLITGRRQPELLELMMIAARKALDANPDRLVNVTQREYCRLLMG